MSDIIEEQRNAWRDALSEKPPEQLAELAKILEVESTVEAVVACHGATGRLELVDREDGTTGAIWVLNTEDSRRAYERAGMPFDMED